MTEKNTAIDSKRDDVATLVRLAGKRHAVPRDRTDRVRAAARAQWREGLQRRSRKRAAWTAAALATAALLVLAVTLRWLPTGRGTPLAPGAPIVVEALAGPLWISAGEGGVPRPVEIGEALSAGSTLRTEAPGGAAVRLASGHSVRLDASTIVRIGDGDDLRLERGGVYVDSGLESPAASGLVVRTSFGEVEEIGTQFEVRLQEDALRVRLREGAVIVHRDAAEYAMRSGTELELLRDGTVTQRAISTHGPDWAWFAGITPMLDLEGRSARTFLDWVARERGWTLAFADTSVARTAGEIVLGGTVAQLTLDEALDAVLPSCRLTHRVQENVLLIDAEQD